MLIFRPFSKDCDIYEADQSRGGMAETSDKIITLQKEWAVKNHTPLNKNNRVLKRNDNLFIPLSQDAMNDYKNGSGDEFGKDGEPGKINSLYSSSALPPQQRPAGGN